MSAAADMVRFVVTTAQAGLRLDRMLAATGTLGSRARVQALLRKQQVLVNGEARKASYALRAGDAVEIDAGEPAPAPAESAAAEPMPLDVLYEDDEVLVLDKPAGLVVHPAPGHRRGTLVNALLHHLGPAARMDSSGRAGLVHRLDKGTSGVLVVAKTAVAHEHLARQFRERTVAKEYLAVVRGRLARSEGLIDRPIGRHPRDRQRMSVRSRRGRASVTRYVVRDDYGMASVVRLFPTTGRMHQLRVHLAAIGHPVVGDPLYGRRRAGARAAADTLAATLARFPRPALHAARLEFAHPRTNVRVHFRAPLPTDLEVLLSALRAARAAA